MYDRGNERKPGLADRSEHIGTGSPNLVPIDLQAVFTAPFSARSLDPQMTLKLQAGFTRSIDSELLNLVGEARARITDRRVSVLELGAGSTWPLGSNYGAPWLCRRMSLSDVGIDVVASDLTSATKRTAVICRDPDGLLSYQLIVHQEHAVRAMSELNAHTSGVKFDSFSRNECLDAFTHNTDRVRIAFWIQSHRQMSGRDAAFFVRPALDSEFERSTFNLSAVGGVNFLRPGKSLPKASFDVVIARHLEPLPDFHADVVSKSVRALLREDGRALLHFDGCGDAPGHALTIARVSNPPRLENGDFDR